MSDLILWAIPAFLAFIGIEWLWSRWAHRPVFKFRDSVTNLACGMGSQVFGLLLAGIGFWTYAWAFDRWRIHTFDLTSPLGWAIALIGVDFCYYWFHRMSHEVNGLWIFHVVHHQSEEYTVALRQSWFGSVIAWIFYVPLAVVGVPVEMYAASYGLNLLYQFIIHTKAVRRLGPLEWILNTPSHHRVHHGRDREYLDKNYAGALIIWDRLFGTFVDERQEPTYGILRGFPHQDALRANVEPVTSLFQSLWHAPTWRERWGVVFKHPGWRIADRTKDETIARTLAEPHHSYQFGPWTWRDNAAFVLLSAALAGTVAYMALAPTQGWDVRLVAAATLVIMFGGLARLCA
jgi:sterol desaturase/sphingolipid hydroxylase (fatty acid hydroxylase superfamily)